MEYVGKSQMFSLTSCWRSIRRGLYQTADGTCVNADLNGAANILRKAVPGAFAGMDVKAILRNINVVRFGNLYKVSG